MPAGSLKANGSCDMHDLLGMKTILTVCEEVVGHHVHCYAISDSTLQYFTYH